MAVQDEVADLLGLIVLQDLPHGKKIAQGFGHFLIVDADKAVVQPVANKGFAGRALGLGYLVFVVRKGEVGAAAMNIERIAQAAGGHCRALDVPAGTPLAPGGSPGGFARFGGFPQHEIQRLTLGFVHFDAGAGAQILDRFAGKPAVTIEARYRKIDVAVVERIGVSVLDQSLNHSDNLADMRSGAGLCVRSQHTECGRIFVHRLNETFGQRSERLTVLVCAVDDLVVDVGNVTDVGDVESGCLQIAVDDIEHHQHPGMSQMAEVVYGHAADIHLNLSRFEGDEVLFFVGEIVIDLQHDCSGNVWWRIGVNPATHGKPIRSPDKPVCVWFFRQIQPMYDRPLG